MNWVDLILLVIVLLCILAGWSRGFIFGSIDLLTWACSFVIGYLFYPYTARLIEKIVNAGAWLFPLAFLVTILVARVVLGVIASLITRSIPESTNRSGVNRFLGIIPGAINGWISAIVASAILLSLPLKDTINEQARSSRFVGRLAERAEWVNRKLAPVFDEAISQTMNNLTIRPGTEKKVGLPFKYNKPVARPELESQMLDMVNKERQKNGLKPLQPDAEMTAVARAHSQDMFARGYFSHVSPDGKDPFVRMKEANVAYRVAGENLALAQTLEIAHNGLMNSPGHRANILHPTFGRLGIGILDGGSYGLMISQEFRD